MRWYLSYIDPDCIIITLYLCSTFHTKTAVQSVFTFESLLEMNLISNWLIFNWLDATSQLDFLGHDGDSLGVAWMVHRQTGVLKQTSQVEASLVSWGAMTAQSSGGAGQPWGPESSLWPAAQWASGTHTHTHTHTHKQTHTHTHTAHSTHTAHYSTL